MDDERTVSEGGVTDESGMMMVDALVGTLIIALFLVLMLTILTLTRNGLERASERRHAIAGLQAAIETAARKPHDQTVAGQVFTTRIKVSEEAYNGQIVCRIDATARAAKSHRVYSLSATRWCAEPVMPIVQADT